MPVEYTLLKGEPEPFVECPTCLQRPFESFMRGMVQRSPRRWFGGRRRPYCAVICFACKQIVGWEQPK